MFLFLFGSSVLSSKLCEVEKTQKSEKLDEDKFMKEYEDKACCKKDTQKGSSAQKEGLFLSFFGFRFRSSMK